jgi:hypothetical protein
MITKVKTEGEETWLRRRKPTKRCSSLSIILTALFYKLRGLLCIELSWTDWTTFRSVLGGYKTNDRLSQNSKNGVSLDVSSALLGTAGRIS